VRKKLRLGGKKVRLLVEKSDWQEENQTWG
jgi:hypothetical protein